MLGVVHGQQGREGGVQPGQRVARRAGREGAGLLAGARLITGEPRDTPLTCSIVWAKPPRLRQGPSSPKAGMRIREMSGFTLASFSWEMPKFSSTRGE